MHQLVRVQPHKTKTEWRQPDRKNEAGGSKNRASRTKVHSVTLGILALLLCLCDPIPSFSFSLLSVRADSGYCAAHSRTPSAASEYTACCGISAEASAYLLKNGNTDDLLNSLVGVSKPFYSCAGKANSRCCAFAPVSKDTSTGATTQPNSQAIQNAYNPFLVQSNEEYNCVLPVESGGCCSSDDCVTGILGDPPLHKVWGCVSNQCVPLPGPCPYQPLTQTRAFILLILPGAIMAMELMLYLNSFTRYLMMDLSCGAFGRHREVVKFGPLCLRKSQFAAIVLLNIGAAIGLHVANAVAAPDSCSKDRYGSILSYLWAILYFSILLIVCLFKARSRWKDSRTRSISLWIDLLVATNVLHAIPFTVNMILGTGTSWLDNVILAQQAAGFRWLPFAILLAPCMKTCKPASSTLGSTSRPRSVWADLYFLFQSLWSYANVALFTRDDFSLTVGYNLIADPDTASAWEQENAYPAELYQLTNGDVELQRTQEFLIGAQVHVSPAGLNADGGAARCLGRFVLRPARPSYLDREGVFHPGSVRPRAAFTIDPVSGDWDPSVANKYLLGADEPRSSPQTRGMRGDMWASPSANYLAGGRGVSTLHSSPVSKDDGASPFSAHDEDAEMLEMIRMKARADWVPPGATFSERLDDAAATGAEAQFAHASTMRETRASDEEESAAAAGRSSPEMSRRPTLRNSELDAQQQTRSTAQGDKELDELERELEARTAAMTKTGGTTNASGRTPQQYSQEIELPRWNDDILKESRQRRGDAAQPAQSDLERELERSAAPYRNHGWPQIERRRSNFEPQRPQRRAPKPNEEEENKQPGTEESQPASPSRAEDEEPAATAAPSPPVLSPSNTAAYAEPMSESAASVENPSTDRAPSRSRVVDGCYVPGSSASLNRPVRPSSFFESLETIITPKGRLEPIRPERKEEGKPEPEKTRLAELTDKRPFKLKPIERKSIATEAAAEPKKADQTQESKPVHEKKEEKPVAKTSLSTVPASSIAQPSSASAQSTIVRSPASSAAPAASSSSTTATEKQNATTAIPSPSAKRSNAQSAVSPPPARTAGTAGENKPVQGKEKPVGSPVSSRPATPQSAGTIPPVDPTRTSEKTPPVSSPASPTTPTDRPSTPSQRPTTPTLRPSSAQAKRDEAKAGGTKPTAKHGTEAPQTATFGATQKPTPTRPAVVSGQTLPVAGTSAAAPSGSVKPSMSKQKSLNKAAASGAGDEELEFALDDSVDEILDGLDEI
jgi:hypothetical protein